MENPIWEEGRDVEATDCHPAGLKVATLRVYAVTHITS
jgi:hypothetical protein